MAKQAGSKRPGGSLVAVMTVEAQRDDDFEACRITIDDLDWAEASEDPTHSPVVREHERDELANARLAGTPCEFVHQRAAHAPASPPVDHGNRELGGLRVLRRADVASDADGAPIVVQGEERLVATVIGMGEVVELLCCEMPDRA
jgi:hypothetical protein